MGREYTRHELLVEVRAAVARLGEGSSRGDLRRYSDDELFRFAVAYLWLRLAEPICQLVTRRLVGDVARRTWEGMCPVRNTLAHDREEDIDYVRLWVNLPTTIAFGVSAGEGDGFELGWSDEAAGLFGDAVGVGHGGLWIAGPSSLRIRRTLFA